MLSRMVPVLGDRHSPLTSRQEEALLVALDDQGVLTVTLNRPAAFNALTGAMVRQFLDTLEDIAAEDTARVIVLDAAGANFCGGADHADIRASAEGTERFHQLLARLMTALTQCSQPVIAKVRGLAASEGCLLVAGSDLAVAGRSARFALPDLDAGLVCALPMVALGRSIGTKRTLDMALTGGVLQADEALELGLIGRLVADDDLDATCAQMAATIAQRPRSAVAASKEALHHQADLPLAQAYQSACEAAGRINPSPTSPSPQKRDAGKSVFKARRLSG